MKGRHTLEIHVKGSNNSSRSSLFSKMTFEASGKSVLLGKAEQECETTRNTPRKWNEHPGNWCKPPLKRTLTHLTEKEAFTDAFSNNEAKTEEIERIRIGSNKICIREDLAKEKMVFSKESSRAIFEMSNVELIELKKSSIPCPSCFHYVFEGTFLCNWGKLVKLDPDAINRIKEAFEILTAPFRASPISTRGSKCGPNLGQQRHHKARDAAGSATKGERGFTSIWDRWQNDEIQASQLSHNWSHAWVRYMDHNVHFSIHHCDAEAKRKKYAHTLFTQCARKTDRRHFCRTSRTTVPGSERKILKSTKRRKENN